MTLSGKSIVVGDLHFGDRSFNKKSLEWKLKYFEDVVFPYMIENNIKNFIQLGDTFDNRVLIDINIQLQVLERFFKPLHEIVDQSIFIVGNHDIYYKDKVDINSLMIMDEIFPNMKTIERPTSVSINSEETIFFPWITSKDEFHSTYEMMAGKRMVFGHFEFSGFKMTGSFVCEHGMDIGMIQETTVLSGHFHNNDGIYIGTPYQLNWNDFGDKRGFYILNEDFSLDFHENNHSPKHLKILHEGEALFVEGLAEGCVELSLEDVSRLSGHKLKLFTKEDSSKMLNLYEKIRETTDFLKVELIDSERDVEVNSEELLEEAKNFDVHKQISANLSDMGVEYFNEIYIEAVKLQEES